MRYSTTLAGGPVSLVDWIIVLFTVLMAVYGYLQGLIVGALSLIGFAVGAFVGARLAPGLLSRGASSPYAPVLGLAGAMVASTVLAFGLERLGRHLRGRLRLPALGVLDGVLGAVFTGCVALGIAWIAGTVALQFPGGGILRGDIQRSFVLRRLNAALPPSGAILHALGRIDPFPSLAGPGPDVAPPPRGVARAPAVGRAADSVVRILGTSCGLGVQGSGWVAGQSLVVTNAHVVAGERDTEVTLGGTGSGLPAQALVFDPRNDVAVLRVPGLAARPLPIARDPRTGTAGAVIGYPENGPRRIVPGRIGMTRSVLTNDSYGRGSVLRELTPFRGLVRSGNSGGPMVSTRGAVMTTAFAAATSPGPKGGFGVPNSIVRGAMGRAAPGRPSGTGPCAG